MIGKTGAFVCGLVLAASVAGAADWNQFRGPNRDGVCTETGLLQSWPEGGPKLLWKIDGMGIGFASVALVGERAYTVGDKGNDEFVIAIDLPTQKVAWSTKIGAAWKKSNDPGSRGTPTVDGSLLYVVGGNGDVVCLESATGKEVWHKDMAKDFGGRVMSMWGWAESPLVDGEKVVVTPGAKNAALVALNKKTGEVIWKTSIPDLGGKGKDGAGYSSIMSGTIAGVPQYVQFLGRGVIGVSASDGKFLWGYTRMANGVANISNPLIKGDYVFASSAYGAGSALLKIVADGGNFKAEEVYFLNANTFQNHHGGVVLVGDALYGGQGQNNGQPTCIDFTTGKILWKGAKSAGKGSAAVLAADGNVIFRYESGVMALIAADPKEYKLKSSFQIPVKESKSWSHPVIRDGKMYVRAENSLLCYDVKQ